MGDAPQVTPVHPGTLLCEAALWTEWIHVGRAEATTACELLEIHGERLVESVGRDMIIMDIANEYCIHFHRRVMSAGPPHAAWPNDLDVPFSDYCDLVVSMKREVQLIIGMDAVALLEQSGRWSKPFDKLTDEVRDGKSVAAVTGEGNVIRVVSLVALRVERPDGHILVQVAKWENSQMKAACQLPGLKQDRGELVGEAVERLFDTKLPFLAEWVTITSTAREKMEKASKEFGVDTRYLKSICTAKLKPDACIDAPLCGTWLVKRHSGDARASSALDPADGEIMAILEGTPVLAAGVIGAASSNCYAWLPHEIFWILSGGGKDHVLKPWLESLTLPEEEAVGSASIMGAHGNTLHVGQEGPEGSYFEGPAV